jgi:hypothetical protein
LTGLSLAEMRSEMRGNKKRPVIRPIWIVVGLLVIIVAYAWIDGGREPLHEITIPVAVPEAAR